MAGEATNMTTEVEDLIQQLTLEEKTSLLAGADEAIERLGIGSAKIADGPAGDRSVIMAREANNMKTEVEDLIQQLTLEEKISLLAGADEWQTVAIERLGIGSLKITDGPAGARGRLMVDGPEAAFLPAPVMQAASWSKTDLMAIGQILCREAKTKAAHIVAAPTICCVRNPLGGRNFETFSEDPCLSGSLAVEYIRGLQETGEIVASAKHFVANEQEHERFSVNAIISEKALREIYLRPFEMIMRGPSPPGCIMTAYNQVNGLHMDLNTPILDGVLRQDWGFQGLVMSDWGGTNSTVESVLAGCDLEMPGPPVKRGQKLLEACRQADANPLLEPAIERSVARILSLAKRMGLLGLSPSEVVASRKRPECSATSAADLKRLREAVANGHVLLKNEKRVLPLRTSNLQGKRVAFLGPNAKTCTPGGGGSASMNPQYQSHPLESFQRALRVLEINAEVLHSSGAYSNKWLPVTSPQQWCATPSIPSMDKSRESGMFQVEFFDSADCSGPVIEVQFRDNSSLDMTDSGPVALREGGRPYSIRISSYVTPKSSGKHHMSLTSVGHSRLYIDGQLLVDNNDWTEQGEAFYAFSSIENCEQVDMNAGQEYKIVIEASTKVRDTDGGLDDAAHVWSMQPSVRLGYLEELPSDMVSDAVELAKTCDFTIVVLGLSDEWESEGYDRQSLALPGNQNELVSALISQKDEIKNLVFVNQSGSPVEMPWADQASTILQAWYGGQEAGNALADVLLGRVNPSGRLPTTWPKQYSDLPFEGKLETWPGVDGEVVYEEDSAVGYRWYLQENVKPQWWFGHGLEYTSFSTTISRFSAGSNDAWTLTASVTNTGVMAGMHVVQIYSWPKYSPAEKVLRAFGKTRLVEPGETEDLELSVSKRDMASWDDGGWLLKAGDHVLGVCDNAGTKGLATVAIFVAEDMTWKP